MLGGTGKKKGNLAQTSIGVLAFILAALIVVMMVLVSGIQGTARVVNYAGLVRGKTQRMVKMEIAGYSEDGMLQDVESFINGLRNGDAELDLVRLDDEAFQNKMAELDDYFSLLRQEIMRVRAQGYEQTEIISKSERFFEICDEATGLAEAYSQRRATSLEHLEKYITVDIVFLMLLIGYELIKALRTAAQNRALQSKVYLDGATGLPNKNKCEELLNDPLPAAEDVGVCSFDLNNLRRINNSMGHEAGDAYVRRFAVALRQAMPEEHFVGRAGGDEFLAITHGVDAAQMQRLLEDVRRVLRDESAAHPDAPLSYAVGYALAAAHPGQTMRELFNAADKNMYINKNHVKREEAAAEKRLDYRLLKKVNQYGRSFADCLYCDAKQDTYRLIRAGDGFFLAGDGSYSGAVEQILEEQAKDDPLLRERLQLAYLAAHLDPAHACIELQYQSKDPAGQAYGKLTAIFVDQDEAGRLHHFLLAFETIRQDVPTVGAKEQLTQYYEQLKQSILENDSYVDALLETADAIYSVNITRDLLEQSFLKKGQTEASQALLPGWTLPCAYSDYCRNYAKDVTPETVESYRLTIDPARLLRRFADGEKQVSVEYCLKREKGPLWLQKTVLMMESLVLDAASGSETPVVHGMILLRDTTALHQREQQEHDRLQAAYEEMTSANRAKTEFLSRMSHDIRTPINGVMGMLEIIKKNRDDWERVDDCLEKIRISSDHLLSLINDVLDMSKLESGHIELEHVPFDLKEVLREIHALDQAQVAETNLTFRTHAAVWEHTALLGSPLHLRQILLNLFSNAVKYNKDSGSIETWIEETGADDKQATFRFVIQDTGIGMSEEFVKNELFQPFTQEKADARTQYKGTGLGMSIVRELVEKMGGSIQTESTQGVGTTFTVTLPFDIDHETHASRKTETETQANLKGLRVLLAEDNALNMEIAEFFLTDLGIQPVKAWNGKEAVEQFAASPPGTFDAILMDVMMPVMNGLDAARSIRALDRPDAQTVPIFAMTANAFREDARKSREAGMNEHLSKPLQEEELARAIGKYVKT